MAVDGESAGGGEGGGDASDSPLNEQQQLAMQQEERVLTEQIESLQKEKYDAQSIFVQRCNNYAFTCYNSAQLQLRQQLRASLTLLVICQLCVCVCVCRQGGADIRDADLGASDV